MAIVITVLIAIVGLTCPFQQKVSKLVTPCDTCRIRDTFSAGGLGCRGWQKHLVVKRAAEHVGIVDGCKGLEDQAWRDSCGPACRQNLGRENNDERATCLAYGRSERYQRS